MLRHVKSSQPVMATGDRCFCTSFVLVIGGVHDAVTMPTLMFQPLLYKCMYVCMYLQNILVMNIKGVSPHSDLVLEQVDSGKKMTRHAT